MTDTYEPAENGDDPKLFREFLFQLTEALLTVEVQTGVDGKVTVKCSNHHLVGFIPGWIHTWLDSAFVAYEEQLRAKPRERRRCMKKTQL
jgi:hypothetical protein